jgi:serine/threonine protein kinase
MIRFACDHCGKQYEVNEEFEGRCGPCHSCNQPVTVPQIDRPGDLLPTTGALSDQQQDGATVGETIALPKSGSVAERSSSADLLAGQSRQGSRYVIENEIARGGMGAVVRATDCDIRREVAVKYMLDESDQDRKARFVEEAQITGQLEHPNIVPIHELGLDDNKRLFFAMKMVHGRSLGQIVKELRDQPAISERVWPLSRLLNIFVNVCHAMAYAHSRGVIHRDLKPDNIMVGDFGEVYVMDWGLAKVMSQVQPTSTPGEATATPENFFASLAGAADSAASSGGTTTIGTIRETDETQDGSIMGTPAYMSPEQARGEVLTLDQRSDLYSLGAILYELMTLQAPIEKGGGFVAVLQRVTSGEIMPPEKRTPQRFRQGWIPKELSAVAMKTLATQPEQRYSTCEALRRDIERFQDGRSVSAKDDRPWEAVIKFAKRNKGFSAAAATGLLVLSVVLAVAFNVNNAARVRAETAQHKSETSHKNFLKEQQAKNDAILKSIPGTLLAARQLANDGAVPEALAQIALVRSYDPKNVKARLLLAHIHLAEHRWPDAVDELAIYMFHHPEDRDAAALHKLAARNKTDDLVALFAVAEILTRHRLFHLTTRLLNDAPKLREAREPLRALYDKQIKTVWPKSGITLTAMGQLDLGGHSGIGDKELTDLKPIAGMQLDLLNLSSCEKLSDLEPLRGMPLTALSFHRNLALKSLDPLRGMQLTRFTAMDCPQLSDLEPLRGMPIEELSIRFTPVGDLGPLAGMPLRKLDAYTCPVSDLEPLRGLPLESVICHCSSIRDLEPLRGAPCTHLELWSFAGTSLDPLRGMPCETLNLTSGTNFENLEPLRGMPCTSLTLSQSRKVANLEPLRGMPLKFLQIRKTAVRDLSPLADMPLVDLHFDLNNIDRGIEVLRDMQSLKKITATGTTLTPTEFWRQYDAGEFKK